MSGYTLAMSDEIHDWLADLRDSDELIANHVVYALAALMKKGAGLAGPLVVSTQETWPAALAGELDRRYTAMLEQMQRQRRDAASAPDDVATHARVQRVQARLDAFRIRKEVLKARSTAVRARIAIHESIGAAGLGGELTPDDSGESIGTAESELATVTAEMERELGEEAWPDGLMELRPGAPGDIGIRLLFAVEPPGTALVLSVLEGRDAVTDHHGQAIVLSAGILRRVRVGQEPDAAAHRYEIPGSFLAEFQAV